MSTPNDDTVVAGAASDKSELSKEDMIELLGEDEDEKPEVLDLDTKKKASKEEVEDDDKDDDKEKEEEVDELKEIEEELKEPTEEDLEMVTPVRRREILAKYPKLFKDFPYLEKAYYREQQFTEVFSSVQDAKEAGEKAAILDNFNHEVVENGNIGVVLKAVKEIEPEKFNKIVDDYLPNLAKVDERAYYHVIGNVIKDTIVALVTEGKKLGEENGQPLLASANILQQFVFGTNTFTPPVKLSKENPEKNSQEEELRTREQEIIRGQFESVRDDLQTKCDNVLRATIEGNIDRNSSMTDYVKKNATREAFETLNKLIDTDTRFRGLLDKLWQNAFSSKFNKESTDRIRSAYLSKAKTLLPTVIKKARNEALKGTGKRVSSDEEPDRKGPIASGRSTARTNSGQSSSGRGKEIPKGMRTLDYLMQD